MSRTRDLSRLAHYSRTPPICHPEHSNSKGLLCFPLSSRAQRPQEAQSRDPLFICHPERSAASRRTPIFATLLTTRLCHPERRHAGVQLPAIAGSLAGYACSKPRGMTLSARNQLKGTVEEIHLGGVMAHVGVKVGDNLIESVITRRSAEEMALKKGDVVKVVIKSTEVMLQKD